jgi:hypothetical protein
MPVAGRQQVDFSDQRYTAQSFWADNSTIVFDPTQPDGAPATMIGKAVTFAASADTVKLAADGDPIMGKLLKVEKDGLCSVQIRGNTTLPAGASATCTPGRKQVGALGAASALGYIRDAASPATYTQAAAAEAVRFGPFCWDNLDLNNVVVDFLG